MEYKHLPKHLAEGVLQLTFQLLYSVTNQTYLLLNTNTNSNTMLFEII